MSWVELRYGRKRWFRRSRLGGFGECIGNRGFSSEIDRVQRQKVRVVEVLCGQEVDHRNFQVSDTVSLHSIMVFEETRPIHPP